MKCFLRVIALLNLSLFSVQATETDKQQPPKLVDAIIVKKGTIQKEFRIIGEIHATSESPGVARADGVFNHIKRSGEMVKAGEVYAEIIQLETNKRYSIAKEEEELAKKQLNRIKQLRGKGSVSETQYDKVKQSWLDKKKQRLQIKEESAQYQLKAPFDGILGTYLVPEGYHVKTGQHVITVFNPSQFEVHFNIPANFIRRLQQGIKVRIRKKQYDLPTNLKFVHRETQSIPIYLIIENEEHYLGEMVDVFVIEEAKTGIIIPQDAVFIEDNLAYVYRINKEDKLEKVNIVTGIETKEEVEIKNGLKTGDIIVSFNPTRLWETQHVTYTLSPDNNV